MTHEELLKRAKEAINGVFSDTSVSKEQAAESLQQLIDEIDILLEALEL